MLKSEADALEQKEIDRIVEAVYASEPYRYRGEPSDPAAQADCEALIGRQKLVCILEDPPDEAVEEAVENDEDYFELNGRALEVYRGTHSAHPEKRVWCAFGETGGGLYEEAPAWAGPAADVEALLPFILEWVEGWHQIEVIDMFGEEQRPLHPDLDATDRAAAERIHAAIGEARGQTLVPGQSTWPLPPQKDPEAEAG